ncbi:hypothetical protein EJ08DRAFT_441801 [Tothia fuscella]|uniref:Zn(2)-C6 fungal-type domain-containing protein n=1 Tax=Tothia fuscella TaxID=1048955 RepID=A0A9P4TVA5_9PEZI|nr:hypothetical protein EJ08DRAFT_441801 [Tothia fuscella]
MEHNQEHSGIKRNKKACTECRQQKVRCDATVDSTEPCSRCRKMQLRCVISDPFKREHKRQRLSELEQETVHLRQRLEQRNSWSGPIATPPASIESTMSRLTPVMNGLPTPGHVRNLTVSTSLEGVTLAPNVIDELFKNYFEDFHYFVPILDRNIAPNDCYQRSTFLFWAIIGTASRNFARDPTLLDCVGDKILNLALMSLRYPSVATIKGLLLVMTWPLPRAIGTTDVTYAISGSLLHIAIQIGLHIPTSSQDFSRVKINLSDSEIAKRAELWGYCVLTYQRSCSFKGHSPIALIETYQDAEQRHTLFGRITPALRFQLKLNSLVTRCCSALLQNGLRVMSMDQEHSLDVIIRVFEASIKDIEPETTSELDKFYLFISRLTIQVFHLYKEPSKTFPTFLLTRMYNNACQVLRHIDRMDSEGTIKLSAAPFYIIFSASLSSFIILRLLKGTAAGYLDVENAKDTFFLGVNIMKRLSAESNDTPARLTMILTQLWNSERAFRNPDGTENTALRIRTRLTMSPVMDAIWWWREEFGGQPGAYTAPETKIGITDSAPPETSVLDHVQGPNGTAYSAAYPEITSFLDDQFLAELGWTSSSNYLFPPMSGTYGGVTDNWYSPTDVNGFAV